MRLFFSREVYGWLPQLQEGSSSGRLEEQRTTRARNPCSPPQSQNKAWQGVGAWLVSHRHVAQGPPSGMEGQSLFLPTQQEWDGPEVGRGGRKHGDSELGHQEVEEINKGFLWRKGSLWSQDGNRRDQLWEEWPGLCGILGPQQADTGRALETHSKEGKKPGSLLLSHSSPKHITAQPPTLAAHSTFYGWPHQVWIMPLPNTRHRVILS